MAAAVTRSNAIQEALWQQAKAVAAKDNAVVPTGLFIETLNDMIDVQEKRLTAARNRVPNIVILALYGIAVVAMAFTGYAGGLDRTAMAASRLHHGYARRYRDTTDPGHRQTEHRLHHGQPTADD